MTRRDAMVATRRGRQTRRRTRDAMRDLLPCSCSSSICPSPCPSYSPYSSSIPSSSSSSQVRTRRTRILPAHTRLRAPGRSSSSSSGSGRRLWLAGVGVRGGRRGRAERGVDEVRGELVLGVLGRGLFRAGAAVVFPIRTRGEGGRVSISVRAGVRCARVENNNNKKDGWMDGEGGSRDACACVMKSQSWMDGWKDGNERGRENERGRPSYKSAREKMDGRKRSTPQSGGTTPGAMRR
ncbi:hypothetical protein FA13DRAFT_1094221 [Coprinellus micaceus]|uniref:Uncharacterized protein n=1 Tax=Coprinellus micaceus TaxID=71717 RepID=A0A4Y7TTY9_COPMI|nr:hypothetical protein FA13DRAFT_1094221 [Coprinellus micaceus]